MAPLRWAWAIVGALQIVATMWLRDDGAPLGHSCTT